MTGGASGVETGTTRRVSSAREEHRRHPPGAGRVEECLALSGDGGLRRIAVGQRPVEPFVKGMPARAR